LFREEAQVRPLVGAEVVAERLGLSVWRVHQLAREDLIPAVHVGRRVIFDIDQVEQWIARGGQALPGGWRRVPALDSDT
jgi:excisionase family DNA binding protein